MNKLVKEYQTNTNQQLSQHGDCTEGNVVRRKEW